MPLRFHDRKGTLREKSAGQYRTSLNLCIHLSTARLSRTEERA